MEGEPITTKISTPSTLSSMKRSQLQKLCKKYGLKANGKNTDLQEKLQQYAKKSGVDIDMDDIEMIYALDIDKSSQRTQYANSISEPTTPQTPSVIPLRQQNKVRSSLVDDSPIKIKTSQHEIKENEISNNMIEDEMKEVNIKNVDHITNNQIIDHLISDEKTETDLNPIFLNHVFKQVEMNDNMAESKMKDVDILNVDHITNNQIADYLVSDEKTDLNPVLLNLAFKQVEMNDNMTESKEDGNIKNVYHNQNTDHLVSDEKIDLNPIFLNPVFKLDEMDDIMAESKEDEMKDVDILNVDHITNNQIADHLFSDVKTDLNPIFLNPVFKQNEMDDNMAESTDDEMKDGNIMNVDHFTNNQIADYLVSDEETDLSPIFLSPVFKQVEMNDNMTESKEDEIKEVNIMTVDHITNNQIADHLFSDEKTDLNLMPAFEQIETNDIPLSKKDIIDSVHKELESRFAILKALPSPERKKILENSKIPMVTPLRSNNEDSTIKQIGSSSANRFAQLHEKAFSQMPSIVTHYAVHKAKDVEETQDEINRKRKDLDSIQPLIKKQKLAHNAQENQVIKAAKDVYKKNEVVKSAVKRTSRSSIRLKNNFPNPEEQKKKEREEFEKRRQAARSVAQPVLEKMKSRKKSKENIEQKQSTQNIKKSILPRRAQK